MEATGDNQLDLIFGALADRTRRAILARLAEGDASVATLTGQFSMSQPAVSKHLGVLERAGLISRTRQGTMRLSRLEGAPLRTATDWLAGYRDFWSESFERLDELLKTIDDTPPAHPGASAAPTTSADRPPPGQRPGRSTTTPREDTP